MAINFPDTPSTGDTHTVGSVTWEWDGATWKSQGTQEVLSATSPLAYDGDTKNLTVDLSSYYTSAQADTAISTAVSNLVDSAPATLDTLNELAAALGDDANFATTVTNSIAAKANSTNPEFSVSGTTTSFTHDIDNLASGVGLYVVWDATNVYVSTTGNNLLSLFSSSSAQIDLTVSYYGTAYTYSTNTISVGVLPSGGIVEYPGNDAFIFAHGGNNPGTSNSTGGGDSGFSSGDQISVSTPTLSVSSGEIGHLDGVTSNIQTQLDSKLSDTPSGTMKLLSSGFDTLSISTLSASNGTYQFNIPSFSSTKKVIAHISFLGGIDVNPGNVSTFGVYIGSNGSNAIDIAKVQTEEQNQNPMIVSGSVHKPFDSGLTASSMWVFHNGTKNADNVSLQVSYAFYEIA